MYKRRKHRIGYQFDTQQQLKKYLDQHPDADPKNHSVKKKEDVSLKKKQPVRKVDLTKTNENSGSSGQYIFQKQLTENDLISFVDENGQLNQDVRVGDLSQEQRKLVSKQIQTCSMIHAEGFSDYSKVDAITFQNNKKKILQFLSDDDIELRQNTRQTPVSKRLDGFIEQTEENLHRVVQKYAQGVRSVISQKALDDYIQTTSQIIRQACTQGGGLSEITQKELDAYLQQDVKRLIYQQVQSRRRSLGDHGIRHLVGNAINSVSILNELQKGGVGSRNPDGTTDGVPISGKDKLLAMSAMVNHDIGYTLGQVAIDITKGSFHKSYSGVIAYEQQQRYAKIFGQDGKEKLVGKVITYSNGKPVLSRQVPMVRDGKQMYETGRKLPNGKDELTDDIKQADGYSKGKPKKAKQWVDYKQDQAYDQNGNLKISQEEYQNCKIRHQKGKEGVIQYHDSSEYDWKGDPIGSAVALSDCTSLFGKDKVQQFFYKNQDAMEDLTKMEMIMMSDIQQEQKSNLFQLFKKKMYSHIQKLQGTSILDKDLLKSQIKQMSIGKFSTIQDILSRQSGVLQGYSYDKANNTVTVQTTYSQQGNVLQNIFGSDLARNQWSKLYKDIKGSGQIKIEQDGSQTLFRGNPQDKNESKILIKINEFNGATFGSSGVAKVYKQIKSFPVRQQIARLSDSLSQLLSNGAKIRDQVSFKKLVKLAQRLGQTVGKKTKGQMIFGDKWQRVKQLLAKARQGMNISKELKTLGFSEEQKSYLSGFFKKSSLNKIAKNIALQEYTKRIAMNIISEQMLQRSTYKLGQLKFIFESNGELSFLIKNHFYKCLDRKSQKDVNKLIKDYKKQILELKSQKDLKQFLQTLNIRYRRLF